MTDDTISAQSVLPNPQSSDRPLERATKARESGHILLGFAYFFVVGAIMGLHGEPGLEGWPISLALAPLLALAAVVKYRSANRAMRIALSKYGNALKVVEPAWVNHGRRLRVALLHVSAVSCMIVMLLTPSSSKELPQNFATWTLFLSSLGVFILLLLPARKESEAQLREKAERSAENVRPMVSELTDAIAAKVQYLAELEDDVRRHEETEIMLTQLINPKYEKTLMKLSGVTRRQNRRVFVLSMVLSAAIGFVINWTSGPLLDALGLLFTQ